MPNKKEKKKMGPIILGILAAIIIILVIVVSNIGNTNVKAMNDTVDTVVANLKENFTVTPVDVGDYKKMKIYGIMNFDVEQYDIEGIGNLSIMRMNALGLMQMSTVVITPQDKNLPLLSADYMYILKNRKAYLEFYDVVAEKDEAYNTLLTALTEAKNKYNHLEDIQSSEAWYADLLTVTTYKAGQPENDNDIKNLLIDSLDVYMKHAKELPLLTAEEKAEKLDITVKYTDGLIEKGGISTDVFKKELGPEETKNFFDNIFFGTAK
ncbi:MAG: hypothetical protein IJE49_12975 [Agathobacter sp.]|nr:hypothetical protein [Agathobacter sp.]